MTVLHAPNVADHFATPFIRRVARELIEEGFFGPSDLDDVIQELRVALIEQVDRFNPDRARWSTFVKTVIRSAALMLRRRQRADCRQAESQVASLNVLIPDADGQLVELGATVCEEEHRTGIGQGLIGHTEQVDLALDVQSVQEQLPADLREICQRLKHQSQAEVARAMGLSRKTLARRIDELRDHFCRAGLHA